MSDCKLRVKVLLGMVWTESISIVGRFFASSPVVGSQLDRTAGGLFSVQVVLMIC